MRPVRDPIVLAQTKWLCTLSQRPIAPMRSTVTRSSVMRSKLQAYLACVHQSLTTKIWSWKNAVNRLWGLCRCFRRLMIRVSSIYYDMASVASQDSISTLSCLCEHCKELLQHQLQALAAGKLASLKLKGIHQNFIDRDTQPCALCAYVWSLVIIEDESRIDHGVSTASTRQSEVKDPLDE